MPSIYLVNPASDFPSYFGAEVFEANGFSRATLIPDLAIATVAGLAPADFEVRLGDENVAPIDLDSDADWIGLTGKVSQWGRMRALAEEFRRRGRRVLIGGPFASLSPDVVRESCDVLVRGEIEDLAPTLFADLRAGRPKAEYVGGRPELAGSPIPRFDLYQNDRAAAGAVQTSRGCPFECEFCDVIQYLGRKQRHKPIAQVLAELDRMHALGYRGVFLCDDNLTVYRSRAKELMEALKWWNTRPGHAPVRFTSQVSIDAARDPELLRLCAEAGLTQVFIGIETPNEESLKETKKRQNVGIDLVERIHRFFEAGIAITGGMIVGFDADGPDIFERQFEFAMEAGIPVFTLGSLVAPAATPLYDRLRRAGRLVEHGTEVAGLPWTTNIVPASLSSEQLVEGLRWLCNRLYEPAAFGERVRRFTELVGPRRDPGQDMSNIRSIDRDAGMLVAGIMQLGEAEARMFSDVCSRLSERPELAQFVMPMLVLYRQIRHLYDRGHFWEPRVASPTLADAPVAAA